MFAGIRFFFLIETHKALSTNEKRFLGQGVVTVPQEQGVVSPQMIIEHVPAVPGTPFGYRDPFDETAALQAHEGELKLLPVDGQFVSYLLRLRDG